MTGKLKCTCPNPKMNTQKTEMKRVVIKNLVLFGPLTRTLRAIKKGSRYSILRAQCRSTMCGIVVFVRKRLLSEDKSHANKKIIIARLILFLKNLRPSFLKIYKNQRILKKRIIKSSARTAT